MVSMFWQPNQFSNEFFSLQESFKETLFLARIFQRLFFLARIFQGISIPCKNLTRKLIPCKILARCLAEKCIILQDLERKSCKILARNAFFSTRVSTGIFSAKNVTHQHRFEPKIDDNDADLSSDKNIHKALRQISTERNIATVVILYFTHDCANEHQLTILVVMAKLLKTDFPASWRVDGKPNSAWCSEKV